MNEYTPTEAAHEVSERWRPRFLARFYESNRIFPKVLNVTEDFSGRGDKAHIGVESFDLTVNDISSDGSLTVQNGTPTDATLIVDKNKDVTWEWTGITRAQAFGLYEEQFPISAGNAIRQKIESDLLALYSSATLTASGDGTGNLGEDELLAAIQQHVSAKLPIMDSPGEFFFALPDNQFAPVKKLGLLDYSVTGEAGEGGAASMKVAMLWNVPVVFSTQVASSGGIRYGLLAHKTALAAAVQKNVTPRFADRLAAAKDSYIGTVCALYGVAALIGGRMGQIKSKA